MIDNPVDLSALDPAAGGVPEELVRSIVARAGPELARRADRREPMAVLADWARPTFAAAAVLAAVSLLGFSLARQIGADPRLRWVPEALGLPGPVAEWVTEGRSPTGDDLLLAMEGGL
jgi:hypothetical protein